MSRFSEVRLRLLKVAEAALTLGFDFSLEAGVTDVVNLMRTVPFGSRVLLKEEAFVCFAPSMVSVPADGTV